jgi:hypothetical protein
MIIRLSVKSLRHGYRSVWKNARLKKSNHSQGLSFPRTGKWVQNCLTSGRSRYFIHAPWPWRQGDPQVELFSSPVSDNFLSSHKTIQRDPTVYQKFYFIFIWNSTCFGRYTAHHQKLKTALAASSFAFVEGCRPCSCWTLSASSNYTSNNLPRMQNQGLLE